METENKYKKGKIYKIVDTNYTKMYIGSTTESLCVRMAKHRYDFRNNRGCSSKLLFEEFGLENCKIELIELFPCNSREELNKKEGEHIRSNICVNKCIPNRTIKELYIANRPYRLLYQKEYYRKKKAEQTQAVSKE
jgi:hypothetical protein